MDCPKDRIPLEIVHFHSIPIQRCPKCEGTWYEKDQLRLLKDKEAHGDYCWINLDLWRDVAKFRAASSSRYTCPADSTPLTPVHYGNASIVVDICQTCKGVWLDKGEYARIIKFLDDTVDAESVGDYLRDLRDEFGEIVKGHPLAGLKGIEKVLYLLELRFFVQHPQLLSGVQSLPRA
jgi:Zn-finger nucleic acid-binding protein